MFPSFAKPTHSTNSPSASCTRTGNTASGVLGVHTPVQRCIRHKERNVLDHLPERDRPAVKQRLRAAWSLDERTVALERLRALAGELDRSHPGAAASLCEGLEETLTLQRLGILGNLKATGEMCLRWTAAGMLEAERQFRRVIGYRDLAQLAVAIERDLTGPTIPTLTREAAKLIRD